MERESCLVALLNRRGNPSPTGRITDDAYCIKRCPEGIDRVLLRDEPHGQNDRVGRDDYLLMIAQPFQCHRMFLNRTNAVTRVHIRVIWRNTAHFIIQDGRENGSADNGHHFDQTDRMVIL